MNDHGRDEIQTSPLSTDSVEDHGQPLITSDVVEASAYPYNRSKYTFITERGSSTSKSDSERRIVRTHVMHHVGRSKRRPGLRPAYKPIVRLPLEIPQSFLWHPGEAQTTLTNQNTTLNSSISALENAFEMIIRPPSSRALSTRESPMSSRRQPEEEHRRTLQRSYHSCGAFVDRFGGGRRNLLFGFPIEMNSRKHELLDHVFNDKLCKGSFTEAWQATSSDPAFLYQLFYWSTLHSRSLRDPEEKGEPHEALQYYANAVRIINGRVQDGSEATSDVTIRLVTMLVFYNYCIGSIENWNTHLNGLKEMIRLRGGLEMLRLNASLTYLLTRIDIGGSSQQDVPPSFPLPEGLSALHCSGLGLDSASDSWEWTSIFETNDQLSYVFDRMRKVSCLIDAPILWLPKQQRMAPSTLNHRLVSPLVYMLLCAQNDIKADDISFPRHEAYRLAGILYLAEIRRSLGVFPVWSTVQVRKLEALLSGSRTHLNWEGSLVPRLWIVTFGAIEAISGSQKEFFEHEMRRAMESMGLESYGDLQAVLQSFLFIDSVHGVKLQAVYASAMCGVC